MHRLVLSLFFVFVSSFFSLSTVQAATISLQGSATISHTTGYLHFSDFNSDVTINTTTGFLSGYAWMNDLGWVAMGEVDNNEGPVVVNLETGVVSGQAKVINTGTFLDFAANESNVVMNTTTGQFSGFLFDDNLGWLDFSTPGVNTETALPTPTPTPTPTSSPTPTPTEATITLTVDENYKFASTEEVVLTGTAPANAKVQVEVHSTPQTGVVTATAQGTWTWNPSNALDPGEHYYVARVDNEDGTFGEWSERTYFTVLGAQSALDNLPVTGAAVGGVVMVGWALFGTGIGARVLGDRRLKLGGRN